MGKEDAGPSTAVASATSAQDDNPLITQSQRRRRVGVDGGHVLRRGSGQAGAGHLGFGGRRAAVGGGRLGAFTLRPRPCCWLCLRELRFPSHSAYRLQPSPHARAGATIRDSWSSTRWPGSGLRSWAARLDWRHGLIALVLFRLFDITKPFPVRSLESLPEGWGIVFDDVAAGLYALGVASLLRIWI